MKYYIARKIYQKKFPNKTFLYFANGTIGFISSNSDVCDFCLVCEDEYEYVEYQFVDNLENVEVIKRPQDSDWDTDLQNIETKSGFAILLYDMSSRYSFSNKGIFSYGKFYITNEDGKYDYKEILNNDFSDSDLAAIEELFFSKLVNFSYREITPNLLMELLNDAETKVDGLIIDEIIDSFSIKGELMRDCKAGKDVDWTNDVAIMESNICYSDSYIEYILPSQKFYQSSESSGFLAVGEAPIPSFFYRDDLDSYLEEKAKNMKIEARLKYSRKEHIMYIFHQLIIDRFNCNAKYKEIKDKVRSNYLKFWHNRWDSEWLNNEAKNKWDAAIDLIDNKITETNVRDVVIEYNRNVKKKEFY